MTDFTVDSLSQTGDARVGQARPTAIGRIAHAINNPHSYLLLLRYAIINIVALALLGIAWTEGWVDKVLINDTTNMSVAIFAVFLGGLAVCSYKVWRVSVEINRVKTFDWSVPSRARSYLAEIRGRDAGSRSLIEGMSIALYTTLVGAILNIWLTINHAVLVTGTANLIGEIVSLGERMAAEAGDEHA